VSISLFGLKLGLGGILDSLYGAIWQCSHMSISVAMKTFGIEF